MLRDEIIKEIAKVEESIEVATAGLKGTKRYLKILKRTLDTFNDQTDMLEEENADKAGSNNAGSKAGNAAGSAKGK